jgi:hypothetical protein
MNEFTRPTDPSHILLSKIVGQSDQCNALLQQVNALKKQIAHEHDEASLLLLNNELNTHMNRLGKLQECVADILDTFRTIPLSSPRLQKAEEFFYNGKFDEMNQTLDPENIRQEVETLRQDPKLKGAQWWKHPSPHQIALSYEMLIKALYHYSLIDNPNWFKLVYQYLGEAYNINANTHTSYETAAFLKQTSQTNSTFSILDQVDIYGDALDLDALLLYQAKAFWVRSFIARTRKNLDGAILFATRALEKFTALCKINPNEYLLRMSLMLMILGDDNIYLKKPRIAIIQYEEAVRVRRQIALDGSFNAAMNLATALEKAGVTHLLLKETREALPCFEEAIQVLDNNLKFNPYEVLKQKAEDLYNLAYCHVVLGKFETALPLAKEKLATHKRIQDIDPFGQLPHIIQSRNLLSNIYEDLYQPENAVREKERVIKLYKTLNNHHPDGRYRHDLLAAINHRSNLYRKMHRFDKALPSLREALELARTLATEDPVSKPLRTMIGVITGHIAAALFALAADRPAMMAAARESCEILATTHRDKKLEKLYQEIILIIRSKP